MQNQFKYKGIKNSAILVTIIMILCGLMITTITFNINKVYAADYPGVEEQEIQKGNNAETSVGLKQVQEPAPEPQPISDNSDKATTGAQTMDFYTPYIILGILCIIFMFYVILLYNKDKRKE